ncbi:hypothetical protein [Microlunatus sp. GCM10028923]
MVDPAAGVRQFMIMIDPLIDSSRNLVAEDQRPPNIPALAFAPT